MSAPNSSSFTGFLDTSPVSFNNNSQSSPPGNLLDHSTSDASFDVSDGCRSALEYLNILSSDRRKEKEDLRSTGWGTRGEMGHFALEVINGKDVEGDGQARFGALQEILDKLIDCSGAHSRHCFWEDIEEYTKVYKRVGHQDNFKKCDYIKWLFTKETSKARRDPLNDDATVERRQEGFDEAFLTLMRQLRYNRRLRSMLMDDLKPGTHDQNFWMSAACSTMSDLGKTWNCQYKEAIKNLIQMISIPYVELWPPISLGWDDMDDWNFYTKARIFHEKVSSEIERCKALCKMEEAAYESSVRLLIDMKRMYTLSQTAPPLTSSPIHL